MRSRVYVTVGRPSVRPSVCLSHRSTPATTAGQFAAERPVGRIYRLIAVGTEQEMPSEEAQPRFVCQETDIQKQTRAPPVECPRRSTGAMQIIGSTEKQ